MVETLTVGDRVAIIPFSDTSTVIGDSNGRMMIATAENIVYLVNSINDIVASGGTNFWDAFTKAFDAFDLTIEAELNVPCNSAILFLTDGVMNEPTYKTEQDVTDLVASRLNTTVAAIGKPILFFTMSLAWKTSTRKNLLA